jgi:hypothetical protein
MVLQNYYMIASSKQKIVKEAIVKIVIEAAFQAITVKAKLVNVDSNVRINELLSSKKYEELIEESKSTIELASGRISRRISFIEYVLLQNKKELDEMLLA